MPSLQRILPFEPYPRSTISKPLKKDVHHKAVRAKIDKKDKKVEKSKSRKQNVAFLVRNVKHRGWDMSRNVRHSLKPK